MAIVTGTDQSEQLDGTADNDVIRGLDGNDYIRPGGGIDDIFCGRGNDSVEWFSGSATIRGQGGDDVLNGGTGNDAIYGGTGNDKIYGADSFDQLFGEGGNDILTDSNGGDMLDGGNGIDMLDFRHDGVFVFTPGTSILTQPGSTAINFERVSISGGNEADDFTGGRFDDQLRGWQANDTLKGMAGNDFLIGDNGDDILDGGRGDDYLTGGGGGDILRGGGGDDTLRGGQSSDLFPGHDWFEGGHGADTFLGGGSSTSVTYENSRKGVTINLDVGLGFGGQAEGDVFQTGVRNLVGSAHNDTLIGAVQQYGLAGNDFLVQGTGTSLMDGGEGLDTYVFRYNTEVIFETVAIKNFDQAGGEKIDLTLADALPGGDDDAFTFLGTGALTGAGGELRYSSNGIVTTIELTLDTSGYVHRITLDGDFTLTDLDFLL